jgi:hypothetical protein
VGHLQAMVTASPAVRANREMTLLQLIPLRFISALVPVCNSSRHVDRCWAWAVKAFQSRLLSTWL